MNVTMLDVLRPDLEKWLDQRGLALAKIGLDSADVTQYVVVIPPGSPLEKTLMESK